jgi:hypothetical protein
MIVCRRGLTVVALSLLATAVVTVGGMSPAGAVSCSIEQLTDHSTSTNLTSVSMNAAGTRLVVSDIQGLDGNPNPGGNDELWRYEVVPGIWVRMTDTPSGTNFVPAVDDSGNDVAFTAAASNPGGTNPDGNFDVVRWTAPNTFAAISTTMSPAGNSNASVNGDGTLVAYGSSLDGNPEIFLDDGSGPDTQITITGASVSNSGPSLNDAGTLVAYTSDVDGNSEIYLRRLTGAQTTTQVTTTASGSSNNARLSDDGRRITFFSDRNFGGGNADGSTEVFQYVVATGAITRLTNTPAGHGVSNRTRSTASGNRVVYNSSGDETGANPDFGQEVFVRDVGGTNRTSQLTLASVDLGPTSADVSEDGTRIAFVSAADPTGDNSDGFNEVFLATCGAPVPLFTDVPASNAFFDEVQWMVERGIASGFPNALFKPLDAVKRQQMANFLYNLAGQPPFTPPATPTFVDVPTSSPFFLQIEWMVDQGIASGFPGGRFKPLDAVKRQQMANFLYNLAGQPSFTPPGTPTFSDVPTTNPFYLQVEWMTAEGIAAGFPGGIFKPLDPVKRQQMARFVFNFTQCCEFPL